MNIENRVAMMLRGASTNAKTEANTTAYPDNENASESDLMWPPVSGDVVGYLQSPPPALQWFVRDRLLADRAHLLTGIGGSSKTRLLYHLAIGAITGRLPWGWHVERTGSAVLFLAEDSAAQVHRTLASFVEHGGITRDDLEAIGHKLRVYPLAGHGAKLLVQMPGMGLQENVRVRDLIDTCKAIPDVAFVGLDPALALTDGDEQNPTHQRRLGELVDRIALELGACVMVASHAAKSLQAAEEIGSHSSRGSGAITDAVRAEYVLRSMTKDEAKRFGIDDLEQRKGHVQLVPTKGNELPPSAFLPTWLVRGQGGLLSEATLVEVARDTTVEPSARDIEALEVLKAATATGTIGIGEWGKRCVEAGLISGNVTAITKAIQRIRDRLLSAGLISSGVGRGVFLPVEDDQQ